MAKASVIKGPYGYFYPYLDDKGNKKGIKLFDEVYDKYYAPGYMTDQHIEDMLLGKIIAFYIPKQEGNGTILIKAQLVDYTNKQGYPCKIIKFDIPNVPDDKSIINANLEKIATSYWNGNRVDYTKPQAKIDSLDLEHIWRTWSTNTKYGDQIIGTIKIYRYRATKGNEIVVYCLIEPKTGKCEMISEEQVKTIIAKYNQSISDKQDKEQEEMNKVNAIRNQLYQWIDNLAKSIWVNNSSDAVIENAEKIVANISTPNLENRIIGLVMSKSYSNRLSDYIEKAKNSIRYNITRYNYTDTTIPEKIKTDLLNDIKVYIGYRKVKQVRIELKKQYQSMGLEAMTDSININSALDLGYFPKVQKILLKYKQKAPEYIIDSAYVEIVDPATLRTNILNMLKIYYDFYDMPEKDRKSVAKYIANNKLTNYYDQICKFNDVLETLIAESRDPRLTKPLLESIAGTSRANVLKDKTFYFEKVGRLRNNVIVHKPLELLERLRSLIKTFNSSSDVAILTNIELDADESFIFQFYTFAGDENASNEFDGRRMLNLTRIYNRHFAGEDETKKIGFWFNNNCDEDDE